MTTPTGFSPNIRILPREASLPADAPKSDNPLAEAALAELLQGGRLGIRDMYRPVDALPVIVADEARVAWFEQQNTLGAGYPDDHAAATDWYVESWQRTNGRPAPGWVKAVTFSPACLAGRCWACGWAPEACGCGHHRPGGRAPYGPVKPADPLPAVAAFLGIAKPAPEAEPVAEEPAPVAEPEAEPAAGEPAPATDATAVLLSMAKPEEQGEPADATAVIEPAKAETEFMPAVQTEGGESDG